MAGVSAGILHLLQAPTWGWCRGSTDHTLNNKNLDGFKHFSLWKLLEEVTMTLGRVRQWNLLRVASTEPSSQRNTWLINGSIWGSGTSYVLQLKCANNICSSKCAWVTLCACVRTHAHTCVVQGRLSLMPPCHKEKQLFWDTKESCGACEQRYCAGDVTEQSVWLLEWLLEYSPLE